MHNSFTDFLHSCGVLEEIENIKKEINLDKSEFNTEDKVKILKKIRSLDVPHDVKIKCSHQENQLNKELFVAKMKLYPKNGEQMWADYKRYSKDLSSDITYDDEIVRQSMLETVNIAFQRIDSFLPDNTVRLPDFVVPAGHHPAEYLAQLSFEGLFKILSFMIYLCKYLYPFQNFNI